MLSPELEAKRLANDPEHLHRKAAYIRDLASSGSPALRERRLARATELEGTANALKN